MTKSTRPEPPREAALIDAARRRARLTVREAAKRAALSDARWRQITSGYQSVSDGYVEVKAPADTLARMAQTLGLTGDELIRVGREDAAKALEEITPLKSAPAAPYTPPVDAVYAILAALPPEAQDEVIRRLGRSPSTPEGHGSNERAG